jgi:TolB protein
MRRLRSLLLSIGLAAALAGLVLAPVSASYPGGNNGRIAFGVRAADGSANIFSVLSNGKGLKQLTTGSGNHLCPAWSADGHTIAYCADTSGAFEIWTMHSDGTSQRQLTHLGGFAVFPDISPDGLKVAFAGFQGDSTHSEIYVVDARSGGGLEALTSCAGLAEGCYNDLPVWSPDGSRIVFIHGDDFDADGNPVNSQVWVMDADGGNRHALTSDSRVKDQVPDWSPDGSKVAYNAGGFGSGGVWTIDADGSHPHQLTGCVAADPAPCAQGDDWGIAWSPDGKKIAFLRDYHALGINDRPVFVMDADGSHQQRLTDGTLSHAVPAWQPKAVGRGS